MIKRLIHYVRGGRILQRVNVGLARAQVSSALRQIDPTNPCSWEFSGFSQNGEDGIIDYLTRQLLTTNRFFVEIGAADGLENNTAFLAIAKKWSGVMIEGDARLAARLASTLPYFNLGVNTLHAFVTKDNVNAFISQLPFLDPDVFSLDIDGNDYYVMQALLQHGFKPKIVVVEYNAALGPNKAITIPYQSDFHYTKAHASGLYYGVSVSAWQALLSELGYQFLSVDLNGVNAIFVDRVHFHPAFLGSLKGLYFAENFYQFQKYQAPHTTQWDLIRNMPFEEIA